MRIALVSFFNTTPFLEGLRTHLLAGFSELLLLPPSGCAAALASGEADMALIPVAALPECNGAEILKGFCIASEGPVNSVLILSKVPLEEITELLPDAQSRTSNLLAEILLKQYWKKEVTVLPERTFDLEAIEGTRAAVCIGDKAYHARAHFPFVYDLASAWKAMTGLPVVFAVWAYHPDRVQPHQLEQVAAALAAGVRDAERIAREHAAHYGYGEAEGIQYITQDLLFTLDERGEGGVRRFLSLGVLA